MSWIIKWVLCRGDYWFLFNKFTSFWGAAHLHVVTVKKVHCAELAVTTTCWPCPWPWPIDHNHSKLVSCCFCNFSLCHRLRRYVRRRGDIIRNFKINTKNIFSPSNMKRDIPHCFQIHIHWFIHVLSFYINYIQPKPCLFWVCKRPQHTVVYTRKQEERNFKDLEIWNVSGFKDWQKLNWKLRFDQNPIYPPEFTPELFRQTATHWEISRWL